MPNHPSRLKIGAALFAVYVIWGSTYLGIRIGLESFPPLLMASIRFLVAGALLMGYQLARGNRLPSSRQWLNASMIGFLMLCVGNGAVTWAEQSISSSVAALGVAIVPLLTVLCGRIWGQYPSRIEWLGIVIGLGGIVLLNLGHDLSGSPLGAALLLLACGSWAFASIWGTRLDLPKGLMSSAVQMLMAGAILLLGSLACGERMAAMPSLRAVGALAYLTVFGSMIAYTAFSFLLHHVRPALASSYAYVNPAIAVGLGCLLGGETIGAPETLAMLIILSSVAAVALQPGRRRG